jgi:hypothetical protein
MENVARKIEPKLVFQEHARVVERRAGGALVVRAALGDVIARRAVSCLVEALPSDLVLLSVEEGGDAFVLAVLERESTGATIDFDGDVHLRSRAGKVTIGAQAGVEILSPAPVGVTTSRLDVRAVETSLVGQALDVATTHLRAEVGKAKVTLDTLMQRARNVFRRVEGLDQVKAKQVDYEAEQNLRLRGENALITADDLVKLNAEQIHLG